MTYPPSGDSFPGGQSGDQSGDQFGGQQYGGQQYGGQQYGGQPYGGQQFGGAPGGAPPENYLVWSILVTVLCCLPLGIVAIMKSTSVNSLWAAGQHSEAHKAAEDAKKFAMWGALSYPVLVIVLMVILFAAGILGSAASY